MHPPAHPQSNGAEHSHELYETDSQRSSSPDESEYENGDQLREFVVESMDELIQSVRERVPNFLNSPSTRDLNVVERVQYLIGHTANVHEENQNLRRENDRLRQQAGLFDERRSHPALPTALSREQQFEVWFKKEIRFMNDLYLDRFVATGCNDMRIVVSAAFNKTFLAEVLDIQDPIHQTKILSCARAYPNWTNFGDWLAMEVCLESYHPLFARVGLDDMNIVRSGLIDENLLRRIGIASVGHRKLIVHEISRVRARLNDVTDEDGNARVPSVDSLLRHLWGNISDELRTIWSSKPRRQGQRKPRGRRVRQKTFESLQSDDAISLSKGTLPSQNVQVNHSVDGQVNGANHDRRSSSQMNSFAERGFILRRQASATDSNRTSEIAPLEYHQDRTVPSRTDPRNRPTRRIARSFSEPNLTVGQSIPSRLNWPPKGDFVQRPPRVTASGWHATSSAAQTAPYVRSMNGFSRSQHPPPRNTAPVNYSSGVVPRGSRPSAYQTRSLSAGNLDAIREQHETEYRRRREKIDRLVEQSLTATGNVRENRTVLVNIVTPEDARSGIGIPSGRSTDVNVGSQESSR